ncbi:MAG: hypothetical protein AAGC57_07185 [Pseudomonadota bacterium]
MSATSNAGESLDLAALAEARTHLCAWPGRVGPMPTSAESKAIVNRANRAYLTYVGAIRFAQLCGHPRDRFAKGLLALVNQLGCPSSSAYGALMHRIATTDAPPGERSAYAAVIETYPERFEVVGDRVAALDVTEATLSHPTGAVAFSEAMEPILMDMQQLLADTRGMSSERDPDATE